MKTENNSKAIQTARKWKKEAQSASARFWEFGKAVHELTENAPHGAKRRLAVALSLQVRQKNGERILAETWQVEISRAIKCYLTYAKPSDAAHFTLDKVSGRETGNKKKARRTQAVIKLEKQFIALDDAEVNALIEARKRAKAAKKSSK